MLKTLHLIIYALLLFAVSSCEEEDVIAPEETQPKQVRCTVIVYMAMENSLSDYANNDIGEMVAGCNMIPDDCRLLVYLDDYYNKPCIYEIDRVQRKKVSLYTYDTDPCSAEAQVMEEALLRMCALAPAEHYGLVLASHGSGWLPGSYEQHTRAIFQDQNHGKSGSCWMDVSDLALVLSHVPHLDFVLMDACMMQTVEVAYTLRDIADYIIASPAEIPGNGGTYNHLLPHFFTKPFDAVALARQYYIDELASQKSSPYQGVVISVVDASEMEALALATRTLVQGEQLQYNNAQRYMHFGRQTRYPDFTDFQGVMQCFADKPCYDAWLEQLGRTVPYCGATDYWYTAFGGMLHEWSGDWNKGKIVDQSRICGVSVFVPDEKYDAQGKTWNDDIRETEWWKAVME